MVNQMEKEETVVNHNVQILERKNISVTGVVKIESFDKKEFFIKTLMGYMLIKGDNLELIKLDTYNEIVSIKGIINSINYLEEENKKIKVESVLSKLFKWI